jgi:hypothetical protein
MSDAHGTREEMALYAMQSFPVEKSTPLTMQLQICSACRKDLAEVWGASTRLECAVQQREIPLGARQRFMERVATAASVRQQGLPSKVAVMQKKSLLGMRGTASLTPRNPPKPRMRVDIEKPASASAVAARVVGILPGL